MAAAMGAPVTVMATAGEGGPWGMAILAAYMQNKQDESLPDYLSSCVFADSESSTIEPVSEDISGFETFMELYQAGLAVEKAAVAALK
jgi:sugar (pentulose or hexulose) kinase